MRNSEERRLQRVVAFTCATLFIIFSFFFVAKYQAPLFELVYDKWATGKLDFNPYVWGATVATVLTVLALWLNKFTGFQREWTAMAYLPSVLILSFISDIDRTLYTGGGSLWGWIVIFVVGFLIYLFLSFVLRRILFEKIKSAAMSANRIIWRNLLIFVIFFCVAGSLSNGEENFKREALVESYYKRGDVSAALSVGNKSLDASRELTAQRAYIMASEGLLGEMLFEYPQLYASKGLLPGKLRTSALVPDSVYNMLGATPGENESSSAFFDRIATNDSLSPVVKDYYLSALLLDKRLVEFTRRLPELYPGIAHDSLPKHYREALKLYSEIDGTFTPDFTNDELTVLFDSLKSIENSHDDVFVRGNYVRKSFGKTYWWYFLYSY